MDDATAETKPEKPVEAKAEPAKAEPAKAVTPAKPTKKAAARKTAPPKKVTVKKAARKAPATAKTVTFDVKALREQLGDLNGGTIAPRSALAKLLGVSEQSITNWETGTVPSASYFAKLTDLGRRVATGKVKAPVGRPRGRPTKASAALAKKQGKKATASKKTKPTRQPDVRLLRARIGKLIGLALAPRNVLADLIGSSSGSVENWEAGQPVSDAYVEKLRAIEARVAAGTLLPPAAKKRGRPPAGKGKAASAKTVQKTRPVKIDVAGLRKALGASRLAFAKLVGSSATTVLLWERGTVPAGKYGPRLVRLAADVKAGKVQVEAPRRGRPPKAAQPEAPARERAARNVPIVGSVEVVYANVVEVVRNGDGARVTFAVAVPGEHGARAVADLLVPRDVIEQLTW